MLRKDRTAADWNYVVYTTAAGGEVRKRTSLLHAANHFPRLNGGLHQLVNFL